MSQKVPGHPRLDHPNSDSPSYTVPASRCSIERGQRRWLPSDVAALAALASEGVEGAIIGKALYTGALTLPAALAAAH